ncbi:cytochrome P450 [Catenuloplanes atrovinosus]|uniref:Cytochrome P450 n=1 Tax=Catenuloplanes atrovinosus TaxID=137266 RepID=A0AAE3YNT5_9ACTN|nr:cytochrome P450 [Catenuloplanes atrovinosus]MDR7276442.1 cytochrome P450 [Catenuloplanes atrovinosus]
MTVDGEVRTPMVRGLPLVGNALRMSRDPARFFVDCYREHGPVFRVRVLGREHAVIAGPEAAEWMGTKEGRESLRSREFWRGLVDEYGATRTLSGEDGPSHKELRDIMRRGYSREAIADRLDEVVAITDRNLDRAWRPGSAVPVLRSMQALVTDQLGELMSGASRPEYVPDIRLVTMYILNVLVTRQHPRLLLHDPRYRRAKRRVAELSRAMIDDRARAGADARPALLIDDLLRANRDNPRAMPDSDLMISVTGPYVAGLDTVANTISAFLYAVLKHPDVLARVRAEADELFARPTLTERDLRGIPAIRGALMETLRLYPIAVVQMRTATRDFTFHGHRIAEGETLYIGTTVPHFLEEFYPDPYRFDIDRYEKPRAEHLAPGAFSPYGRGQHVCLGKTLAEVQMLVTMARIFHRLDLSLESPGYELARKATPTPGPALSFRVRVDGHRA